MFYRRITTDSFINMSAGQYRLCNRRFNDVKKAINELIKNTNTEEPVDLEEKLLTLEAKIELLSKVDISIQLLPDSCTNNITLQDDSFKLLGKSLETVKVWQKKLESVPSPSKNSPPITPPKPKKSRVEEFVDENKDAKSVIEVVGKASAIISDLEKDNEDLEGELKKANAKLNMRPSIDLTEQNIVPFWILSNRNLTLEQRLAVS